MVADHPGGPDLAQPLDDLVRMGPDANDIPGVPPGIDLACSRDDGIERRQVRLDVRDDRDASRRRGRRFSRGRRRRLTQGPRDP